MPPISSALKDQMTVIKLKELKIKSVSGGKATAKIRANSNQDAALEVVIKRVVNDVRR